MGSMDFPKAVSAYALCCVVMDVARIKGDDAIINKDAASLPHKKGLGIDTCQIW